MKNILLFLLMILGSRLSFAQYGCTDPAASNYNPVATANDGSCLYGAASQVFNLKVNTPGVNENSGIIWINGSLFAFNDSGNPPNFYKIDTVTGAVVQVISVTNYGNTDWEDITADTGFVYIGDFGNNNGDRTDLKVLKIKLSDFISNPGAAVTVTAQAINFSYSDQTVFTSNSNTNFDCESVISVRDSLYLFSKDRGDLQTRVYKLSKTPGTYTLTPYSSYNVNGKITGADYNPVNNEVVLIGYMGGDYNSFIWYLSDFQGVKFFSGNKRRVEIGNSYVKWQTEGICFYNESSTNRLFVSCENNGTPAGVYSSVVNAIAGVNEQSVKKQIAVSYRPDNSISVVCDCDIEAIAITNVLGQEEKYDISRIKNNEILLKRSGAANEQLNILKLQTASGYTFVTKIIY